MIKFDGKKTGIFAAGVAFGTAGIKILTMLTSHYFPTQTLKTLINTELFVILLVDK